MTRFLRSPDVQTAIALSLMSFHVSSVGVIIVLFSQELGVRLSSLSWMGSAFGVGLLVGAVAGPALLRRGPQRVLAASALGVALGMTLVATAPALPLAALGIAVVSLAGGGTVLSVSAILSGPGAETRLTRANAGASVVAVLAPLLIGAFISMGISGRLALLVAVPPLLLTALAAARSPDPVPDVSIPPAPTEFDDAATPSPAMSHAAGPGRHVEPTHGDDAATPSPATSPGTAGAVVVKRPATGTVLARWLAVVMSVAAEFSFLVWGVARLVDSGLEAGPAATLGAVFPLGMAVGRIVGPWVLARVPAVPLGAGLAAVGTAAVVVGPAWPVIALGLLLAGLGIAVLYPVTLARLLATPRLPQEWGSSLGALASGVAIVLAPAGLALLGDVVELRLAFLVVLPMLAALALLYGRAGSGGTGSGGTGSGGAGSGGTGFGGTGVAEG